jgi:ADP-ribosylglycohydrolase
MSTGTNIERLRRARVSLEGLSVGDGFGQKFFFSDGVEYAIESKRLPDAPWYWTDDTAMALSLYDCLETHGKVDADDLAVRFAKRYESDPARGYGGGMHSTLKSIGRGQPWQKVTTEAFDGMGSFGNGAAMRIGPLGAYFADDLETLVAEATLSSRVTHSHEEAIAGGIAVAVATSFAANWKTKPLNEKAFLQAVIDLTPSSEVRSKLEHATRFSSNTTFEHAVEVLGCGWQVSAQDTVPFCIWSAAKHLEDFVEAMWFTVKALGDRDTTCAIVGSIVACNTGIDGIPKDWRANREFLPIWEKTS